MKYTIGIDGGMQGGLCCVADDKIVELITMPIQKIGNGRNEYDCDTLIAFLLKYPTAVVVLEKAQYTPALGGMSAFSFGKSYGTMIGILAALQRRYHLVAARTWQTKMFRDQPHSNTKEASIAVAKRLFPGQSFKATERSKKDHDGLTDSTLLCVYAQQAGL